MQLSKHSQSLVFYSFYPKSEEKSGLNRKFVRVWVGELLCFESEEREILNRTNQLPFTLKFGLETVLKHFVYAFGGIF